MLVCEDVEKIQEFPPCRLQDISISSDKVLFFVPAQIREAAL